MMVRFFCAVAAGPVGDLGYHYLVACRDTGAKVRALPIGPASFGIEKRWYDVSSLFATPMALPFINIVCASSGMPMGMRTPASAFSTSAELDPELRRVLGPFAGRDPVVTYEPATALAGLYTARCKANIAIVRAMPLPDENELAALRKYDRVICPNVTDVDLLVSCGVAAIQITPTPDAIALVLKEMGCEFDTTATTPSLAVLAGQPGTTSSRSTKSTTSSSRSRALAKGSPAQSPGTKALTPSPALTTTSWVSRMWRFITRLFAFWRR